MFSALALLTNWEYAVKFDRHVGLNSWAVEPIVLPLIVAVILVPILLVRSYRLLRTCLARGVMIPRKQELVDWRPCLALIPLFWGLTYSAVGIAPDGAMYTRTFSYGCGASLTASVVFVLLIVLYQFHASLKRVTESGNTGNPGASVMVPRMR
jgi:hypothetical protein